MGKLEKLTLRYSRALEHKPHSRLRLRWDIPMAFYDLTMLVRDASYLYIHHDSLSSLVETDL